MAVAWVSARDQQVPGNRAPHFMRPTVACDVVWQQRGYEHDAVPSLHLGARGIGFPPWRGPLERDWSW